MVTRHLRRGTNEILLVARNLGSGPNPAGLYFEARLHMPDGSVQSLGTGADWEGTAAEPDGKGRFKTPPAWQPAVVTANPGRWMTRTAPLLKSALAEAMVSERAPVRAALVKSDLLMRTLGRPNREQIVSTRPNDLTTLEAIDLANGPGLASLVERGAAHLSRRSWKSPDDLIQWIYRSALSRPATRAELALARELAGPKPGPAEVQDLLWAVVMLPEFQLVR